MLRCPNCAREMSAQRLEAHGTGGTVEVDACTLCNLLWFDRSESVALTPKAVLELFQYIGKVAGGERATLASNFSCPRCSGVLTLTHDLQRTTRFLYWRCPRDLGQLITFNQFLRAKNFLRTPSPPELAKLRASIHQITCSQCGAPIDLDRENACGHCGASIALIDPDGIAKAVRELSQANPPGEPRMVGGEGMRTALNDAQIEALFSLERDRDRNQGTQERDLLALGVGAVGALVGAWLAAR